MNAPGDADRLSREFQEWLDSQRFAGVQGSGISAGGVRIYIDPRQFDDAAKKQILEKAGQIAVDFVESPSSIKFL